jgi:hypothetical protein
VSPVKYELGFYIPEGDILHSDRREDLKSYMILFHDYCEIQSVLESKFRNSGDIEGLSLTQKLRFM